MTRERFIFEARACQGQLRRFLASLCGDAALADDIAQEALVRAYVVSDRFAGSFKAWLFRIAYNCFIDNLRRVPPPAMDLNAPEALHVAGNEESDAAFRHEELKRALSMIPEKERVDSFACGFETRSYAPQTVSATAGSFRLMKFGNHSRCFASVFHLTA